MEYNQSIDSALFGALGGFIAGAIHGYSLGSTRHCREFLKELKSGEISDSFIESSCKKLDEKIKNDSSTLRTVSAGSVGAVNSILRENIDIHSLTAFGFAYLVFKLGFKIANEISAKNYDKKFKKINRTIDEALEYTERDMVMGGVDIAYLDNLTKFIEKQANKLDNPEIYGKYFISKARSTFKRAKIYVQVKDFTENMHENRIVTSVMEEPDHFLGYIILFDDDKIIKASAIMDDMSSFKEENVETLRVRSHIHLEGKDQWNGDLYELSKEIIDKRKNHTVVLTAGGEHLPIEKRISRAMDEYIVGYYFWKKEKEE